MPTQKQPRFYTRPHVVRIPKEKYMKMPAAALKNSDDQAAVGHYLDVTAVLRAISTSFMVII